MLRIAAPECPVDGLELREWHPTGRSACHSYPCSSLATDGNFFSLRSNRSLRFATFTKIAYVLPRHPNPFLSCQCCNRNFFANKNFSELRMRKGCLEFSTFTSIFTSLAFLFDLTLLSNLSNGGDSPTPPFGGTPPALRLPPTWNFIQLSYNHKFSKFLTGMYRQKEHPA